MWWLVWRLRRLMTSLTSLVILVRITIMKKQNTVQALNTVGMATKAKARFSAVLAQAGYQGQRIIIKKGTRPTAVSTWAMRISRGSPTLKIGLNLPCSRKASRRDQFVDLRYEVTRRLRL